MVNTLMHVPPLTEHTLVVSPSLFLVLSPYPPRSLSFMHHPPFAVHHSVLSSLSTSILLALSYHFGVSDLF